VSEIKRALKQLSSDAPILQHKKPTRQGLWDQLRTQWDLQMMHRNDGVGPTFKDLQTAGVRVDPTLENPAFVAKMAHAKATVDEPIDLSLPALEKVSPTAVTPPVDVALAAATLDVPVAVDPATGKHEVPTDLAQAKKEAAHKAALERKVQADAKKAAKKAKTAIRPAIPPFSQYAKDAKAAQMGDRLHAWFGLTGQPATEFPNWRKTRHAEHLKHMGMYQGPLGGVPGDQINRANAPT